MIMQLFILTVRYNRIIALLISYIILNKRYNSQGFYNIGLLDLKAQNETLFAEPCVLDVAWAWVLDLDLEPILNFEFDFSDT